MKTRQSIMFEENGNAFEKRLKHCNTKEKIVLYSTKELTKDYISKLNNDEFEIDKFKLYFENGIKSLFSFNINLDEKTYLVHNNKYVFLFYFLDDQVKKNMWIAVN